MAYFEENSMHCLWIIGTDLYEFEAWPQEHFFQTKKKTDFEKIKVEEGWKLSSFHNLKQKLCQCSKSAQHSWHGDRRNERDMKN